MHFLKKLMICASLLKTVSGASFEINIDAIPAVSTEIQKEDAHKDIARLFDAAISAINRAPIAERVNSDRLDFLLSSGLVPQFQSALDRVKSFPIAEEEKAKFTEFFVQNALKQYSDDFEKFLSDVQGYPEPFLTPLKGFLSLIAGRGQTFTGCGGADQAVSEQVKERLFSIFESAHFLSPQYLAKLRAPYDVKTEVGAFLSANPNLDTLVIAGSHVNLTSLPYDPHRGCLVVNLDPQRGADIVAPISEVLPYLPDAQFSHVIDDSNFWGELLIDTAKDLFRVMKSGGTIGDNTSAAYRALIAAGFEGMFEECSDPNSCIESIGDAYIHSLDLDGLKQFLGEGVYGNLIANIPSENELSLTEETQRSYFTAYRAAFEAISDKAALLNNVQDGSVYIRSGVFKVKDGKIHVLKGFVKP